MVAADLEREVLVLDGGFGRGSTIPAGTEFDLATLTTSDPDAGPQGELGLYTDPYQFAAREAVTFRIDGRVVATRAPQFFEVTLATDEGDVVALGFTAAGKTYLLPQANVDTDEIDTIASRGQAHAPSGPVAPYQYGLVAEDAHVFYGQVFTQVQYGATITDGRLGDFRLYDQDGVRGNADSGGEEIGIGVAAPDSADSPDFRPSDAAEVIATVQFADGEILAVRALADVSIYNYGRSVTDFVFDDEALARSGHNIADVVQVLDTTGYDHDLNWTELGFTDLGPADDPLPPPPPPVPTPVPPMPANVVRGTAGDDYLEGGVGRDVFYFGAGDDIARGGRGDDTFVIGREARDGVMEWTQVQDFEADHDVVALAKGAKIASIQFEDTYAVVTFKGDGDQLALFGTGITAETLDIIAASDIPFML